MAALTACSAVSAGSATPDPLITVAGAHCAASQASKTRPPAREQASIDYFESLLGAGLGGAAYVRS